MKKISIILITKNASQTLEPCLEKLTQQTFKNIEILMLDADSTDNTIEIAKKKLGNFSNAKIICKKAIDLMNLRMEAISIATGEYVLFVLPTDTLNIYACEILYDAMETNEADLVIGSFSHPLHNTYISTSSYTTKKEYEKLALRYNFLVFPFISGKLYKREIVKKIVLPDFFFHEELLNLKYLEYAEKIITLNQILVQTKEHLELFDSQNFWTDKNSFWFKTVKNLQYLQLLYKKEYMEYVFLSALEHLLFELLVYKARKATLEELTMELYAILISEEFMKCIQNLPHTGLSWRSTSKELLLTNCITFIDCFNKQYNSANDISLFKLNVLVFIKIFFKQTGSLNSKEYLGLLQENLNLAITEEAKFIQNLDI